MKMWSCPLSELGWGGGGGACISLFYFCIAIYVEDGELNNVYRNKSMGSPICTHSMKDRQTESFIESLLYE